jgi:hypothetical protein
MYVPSRIEFRCRKRRKRNPTISNKAITHSEVHTSTPQRIMLKEIRTKRLIPQRIKPRNGETPWKRKGKETPKQESRKIISLSKRKGKLAAVKLFPKVLQQTELASLNLRGDSSDDVNDDIAEFENKVRDLKCDSAHLSCLGEWRCSRYRPATNYVCEYC